MAALGEIETEAKRVLPRLGRRCLVRDGASYVCAARGRTTLRLGAAIALRLEARGLLKPGPEPETLALSEDGEAFVRRAMRPESAFLAQHASLVPLKGGGTLARHRETPERLRSLAAPMRQAAARFERDCELASLRPRVTADWSRPKADTGWRETDLSASVVAARARVRAALEETGPDFAALLIDVCALGQGFRDAEASRQWPRGTASAILKLALARLAAHYGLMPRPGLPAIVAWHAEADA